MCIREGFYDGTIFHRVIPGFMVQAGGFTPDMKEKPAHPPIRNEARNLLRNSRGSVAMARTGDANSASSQHLLTVHDGGGDARDPIVGPLRFQPRTRQLQPLGHPGVLGQ